MQMVACPVHDQRVAIDAKGRVVGVCQDCMSEAAEGIALIENGVARSRAWATRELEARGRRAS
jgi:hypothetical protein